jgi:hypothetical protein
MMGDYPRWITSVEKNIGIECLTPQMHVLITLSYSREILSRAHSRAKTEQINGAPSIGSIATIGETGFPSI